MSGQEFYEIASNGGRELVSLRGDWVIDNSREIVAALPEIDNRAGDDIDASGIGRMDSWGAMRLRALAKKNQSRLCLNPRQQKIFEFLPEPEAAAPAQSKGHGFAAPFVRLGKTLSEAGATSYAVMSFIGEIGLCLGRNMRSPSKFRFHSIVRHIDETGFKALPIIGLLAVLISMVISYQAATQLSKFGANVFTIDLTVISLLREMGVLVTAIMVAGRSGSAFAAEIGVMKLREEVDALKTMGMDPIEILVVPRLLAMMITLPLLAFLADIIGLAGGAVISIILLDIPLDMYIDRVEQVAKPTMFFVGLIKAPVFAFVITIIGAYQGMNVSGSAESVGRLTTLSVVQSIFLVIMIDAMFSILFANLGI